MSASRLEWGWTVPKMVLKAVRGGLGVKHKYLAAGCRSDFRLEAHQVLRLVYILTFTTL
jgi:hypothetical protein